MDTISNEVTDISDGICAYIQGGLGNQLFILAAAIEQSNRLGCPLYIDSSKYVSRDPLDRGYETQQEFLLGSLEIDATHIATDSPWFRNSPRRPKLIRRRIRHTSKLKVFSEKSFSFQEEINEITPGTTIFGYFQSPKYFKDSLETIASIFEPKILPIRDRTYEGINVHIRRGDYLLQANTSTLGLAGIDYFKRAMKLMSDFSKYQNFQVFSDSPELVMQDFVGYSNITFRDMPEPNDPLNELLSLSNSQGLIMSNSSFSWWAAWLMKHTNPSSIVIAPRPWQLKVDNSSQILPSNWISLG